MTRTERTTRRRFDMVALLALVIGGYGAGLATWSAVREDAYSQRRFTLSNVVLLENDTVLDRRDRVCRTSGRLAATVINIGSRPITIVQLRIRTTHASLQARHGQRSGFFPVYTGTRLPRRLNESAQITMTFDLNSAQNALARYGVPRIVAIEARDNSGLIESPVPAEFVESLRVTPRSSRSELILPCRPRSNAR